MIRPGPPEVLEYVEVPTPVPTSTQVLVRAHTIGVNMAEVHVRRGTYSRMPPLPAIPGIEMTGTIEAVGARVTGLSAGQPVYVSARELPERCGCYAEYIAVDPVAVRPLPADADLEALSTLSSYQVAWHLLNSATRGFEYESVLVTAAAGGVGTACVQLAAAAGKRVIALTSTAQKALFAREQGAQVALVYGNDCGAQIEAATEGRGADLILDAVAGARFPELLGYAAPLGLTILYGYLNGWPDSAGVFDAMRKRFGRSPALRLFSMHTFDSEPAARHACTSALHDLFTRGTVRPVIYRRLPLPCAAEAHALLEAGSVMGKLVLQP